MVDVDRSFHGAVLEPIDPREWGLADTGATAASDTHAFAILAWEVRTKLISTGDKPLNRMGFVARFSLGSLHSPTRASSQGFIQC